MTIFSQHRTITRSRKHADSSDEHKMDVPIDRADLLKKDPAYAEHSTPADIFLADISYAPH